VPRCHFREFHVTDVSKRHVTLYAYFRYLHILDLCIFYIYIYNIHKSKICKFIYNGILKCPHGSMSLSGTIYVAYHCTDLEQFLFRILCTSHVILILFTIAFVSF